MDETVVTILLVVFYFVAQIMGGKKSKQKRQKQRSPQRQPGPLSGNREEGNLEDALREIRTALGYPQENPSLPKPIPAPPTTLSKLPKREPAKRPRPSIPTPSTVVNRFEHDPGLVEFTQPENIPDHLALAHPAATATPKDSAAKAARRNNLARQLQKPNTIRDAIILAEVLGPPRSRK